VRICVAAIAIVGAISIDRAGAEQSAATELAFEVSSIKTNRSGDAKIRMGPQPGGRFSATNVTVRQLIQFAYQLHDFQIVGGPSWTMETRFNVEAKGRENTAPDEMPLMMRQLLRERFQLTMHSGKREIAVRELVVASRDGSLGPGLRPAVGDCASSKTCGVTTAGTATVRDLRGRQMPIAGMVQGLTIMTDGIVVDRTNLVGEFDFELTWSTDLTAHPGPDSPPGLETAVVEQLGLRLQQGRGIAEVQMIDHVAQPTAD